MFRIEIKRISERNRSGVEKSAERFIVGFSRLTFDSIRSLRVEEQRLVVRNDEMRKRNTH